MTKPVCVVLGYGHFGCAGLDAVLAAGAYVPLVLSHADQANDIQWWPSLRALAARRGIPVALDADLSTTSADGSLDRLRALKPDYLFSFYFKHLIGEHVLAIAERGAFNLHGSLLPKYRGRVPVNWQLVHGERRSGLTIHRMVPRADAGDIIAQQAIEVPSDQDAYGLTQQMLEIAPSFIEQAARALFSHTVKPRTQDLSQGSVFPGRKPADGCVDWHQSARAVFNLVRAVAPPWPGAFTHLGHERLLLNYCRIAEESGQHGEPGTILSDGSVACGNGRIDPTGLFNAWANPQRPAPGSRFTRAAT